MDINLVNEWKVNPSLSIPLSKQLADNIRWSISTGALRPGEKILPLRDMAQRLSLSVSTVRAAYKSLESQHLIVTRPHLGTSVSTFPAPTISSSLSTSQDIYSKFASVIVEYMSMGFSIPEIQKYFNETINNIDNNRSLIRVLLVDSSEAECKVYSNQIKEMLHICIDFMLIPDFEIAMGAGSLNINIYNTVATTYFHYSDIIKSMKDTSVPVVGLVMDVDKEFFDFFKNIKEKQKIGIICSPDHAMQYIINKVQSQKKSSEVAAVFTSDNNAEIFNLIQWADSLVVPVELVEQYLSLANGKPICPIACHINAQSIEMLHQCILNQSYQIQSLA